MSSMLLKKTPESSTVTAMRVVSPEHLNAHGTLFGGYLMCWVDEIAYLCARRHSGTKTCATVFIDNVHFRYPVFSGDHVILSASVVNVGRTSMDILVEVKKEGDWQTENESILRAFLTFVALSKEGVPVPVPSLDLISAKDMQLEREVRLRKKIRRRFEAYLERAVQNASGPESLIPLRGVEDALPFPH